MSNKQIKAVIFDLGDTLLNFGKVVTRRLFCESTRLSYDFLQSCGQEVGSYKIHCLRNLMSIYMHHWLSNLTGKDFDALELLKKINRKSGASLTEEQWEHLVWLWYEPLGRLGDIEPDIVETMTKLKNLGMKLGILSNTFVHSSALEKHLRQAGIVDFFELKMYSYQFKFRKPNPKIFQAAAERIGLDLENILYVGDRIENDIEPTLKLGMHAALKAAHSNEGRKVPEGAWKINHISELPELIEKHNAKKPELKAELCTKMKLNAEW